MSSICKHVCHDHVQLVAVPRVLITSAPFVNDNEQDLQDVDYADGDVTTSECFSNEEFYPSCVVESTDDEPALASLQPLD